MARRRLKELEWSLQDVDVFDNPNVQLEQYPTTPHIAAHMLFAIQTQFGDIENKNVADLGSGCGILSIGASMLGCGCCTGFDIDADALEICQRNMDDFEIDNIELVQLDITACPVSDTRWRDKFNTVVMNPPFGTKQNSTGVDMNFLRLALQMSTDSVYSLHKTSTRKHMERVTKAWGVSMKVIAQLKFDLPRTYKFHKQDSVDIEVDFIRFTHTPKSRQLKTSVGLDSQLTEKTGRS